MRKIFIALASAATVLALSLTTPVNAQGTLRVALPSNPNTLDPAKTKIGEEYIINFLVYSGLTELDPNGTPSRTSRKAGPRARIKKPGHSSSARA